MECEHGPGGARRGPFTRGQCRVCWLQLNVWATDSPGLWRKLAHFARALARHARRGFRRSTEAEKRLAICEACPLYHNGACLHRACGCKMKRKVAWEQEHCPLLKW